MVVVVESGEGLWHEIVVGGKRVVVDEPLDVGGSDQGLNPYELLLGALGACTSMTILLYARRKKWPVEHVRVELDHSRVHVRDCEGCDEEDLRLDYFRKRVFVRGPLSEEQRAKLEEISQKCPVHRTLRGTIRIDDELRLES